MRRTRSDCCARAASGHAMAALPLAHEVSQPIAATAANANACLRWLTREPPDLEEARASVLSIVNDAKRAGEIISRIRLLLRKGAPQWESVDLNEIIREMIVLLRSEVTRHSISVRAELAPGLLDELPSVSPSPTGNSQSRRRPYLCKL
jgi:C4-dicarboxylate-specific signal transduction histidine kinase